MKKILIYTGLFLLITSYKLAAQAITTTPDPPISNEELKITVDVSSVPILAGKPGPMYIWTWGPNDPPIGNGTWDNSNEALKMTKEGDNVWSFTMTPTTFYNKPANDIKEISFLVKEKNGNGDKKTGDLKIKINPPGYIEPPKPERIFPTQPLLSKTNKNMTFFSENDIVTIYYDLKIAEKEELKALTELYIYTAVKVKKANGTEEDWQYQVAPWDQVGNTPKLKLTPEGNNVFSLTFIPRKLYNVAPTDHITQLNIIFRNKQGTVQTSNIYFEVFCK